MDMKTLKEIPPWDWPEDTGTRLLEILRDENAEESDRLIATKLAGDLVVFNDNLANVLLAIVSSGDETEKIRCTAAITLGPSLEESDMMLGDDDKAPYSDATIRWIKQTFRKLFFDADVPRDVRRGILEASVRSPQDWHNDAVREAYESDDEDWRLTAVFCMCYISGFDKAIIEALDSENPDIHYQAVCAAGNWKVDAVWPHVAELVTADDTEKHLRLAAIDAAANIRSQDAPDIIGELLNSKDKDIVEAAFEALAMAEGLSEYKDLEEEDDD